MFTGIDQSARKVVKPSIAGARSELGNNMKFMSLALSLLVATLALLSSGQAGRGPISVDQYTLRTGERRHRDRSPSKSSLDFQQQRAPIPEKNIGVF